MTRRFVILATMFAIATVGGCSGYIKTEPGQQVDVSGTINDPNGKPLNKVMIYFQATAGAAQGVNFPIKDGKFTGKMNAGKYTYYLGGEGQKYEAALKLLPQKWKEGSMDRQIDVVAGEIIIKF